MMLKSELFKKAYKRKSVLNITDRNLSKLSNIDIQTISKFLNGSDVELETIKKIVNILGLDILGNELIDIQTLKENRAKERALYIVGLVQDTSALELQGLEDKELNLLIEETKEQFLNGAYQDKLWCS